MTGPQAKDYTLHYQAHLAGKGDTPVYNSGDYCGTKGEGRKMEGIHVWLQSRHTEQKTEQKSGGGFTSAGVPLGRVYISSAQNKSLACSDRPHIYASDSKAGWDTWTISDAGNGLVCLTAHLNQQLQVNPSGNTFGFSTNKSQWEQFKIEAAGNGRWRITAHTGNNMGMADNGDIYCNNKNTGGWETWAITHVTPPWLGKVLFSSAQNKRLACSDRPHIYTSDSKAGWDTWTVTDAGNGLVCLTSHQNQQLQVNPSGNVLGLSSNKAQWEQWGIAPAGNNRYFLIAHTGNHLGMTDSGDIYCKDKNTGGWETWAIDHV